MAHQHPYVSGPPVDNTIGGLAREEARVGSLAERVLRVIATEGPFHSTDDIVKAVREPGERISIIEVATILHTLGKAGKVNTRRRGGDNAFTHVEATKVGFRAVGVPEKPVAASVGHAGGLGSLHPGDPTDWQNHGSRAEGGPITVTKPDGGSTTTDPNWQGNSPEVVRNAFADRIARLPDSAVWELVVHVASMEGAAPKAIGASMGLSASPITARLHKAQTLGWLTKTGHRYYLTPEAKDRLGLPERARKAIEADKPKPRKPDPGQVWPSLEHTALSRGGVHTPGPGNLQPKADSPAAYPALAALIARAGKLERMAADLEAEGFVDEALAVLARLDALSPLEREVLRLVRQTGVKV